MTIIPSPRGQKRARIEIIPLIDIMFFLLATFVMVSLSMVKNQGIPVRLPSAATGQP
jgi:biopolymer transport protein ExbD